MYHNSTIPKLKSSKIQTDDPIEFNKGSNFYVRHKVRFGLDRPDQVGNSESPKKTSTLRRPAKMEGETSANRLAVESTSKPSKWLGLSWLD